MSDSNTIRNEKESKEGSEEFPPVPEEAIVKPEDEHPVKRIIRTEEKLEEKEADTKYADIENQDMDSDGSPDWEPALGPSY